MRDDPTVNLVMRARDGDRSAWNGLVEQYAPLVWSVCRRFSLVGADADDIGQSVWLRLVEHLAAIRDPAALPGWLATTTRRECLRLLRARQDRERFEAAAESDAAARAAPTADEVILAAERNNAIRAGFAQLPPACQELLSLLARDPPLTYAEISAKLGGRIGGLGPRRGRCLEKLRRYPPLAALIASGADIAPGADTAEGGDRHDQPMAER